jgi:hypothetical protein
LKSTLFPWSRGIFESNDADDAVPALGPMRGLTQEVDLDGLAASVRDGGGRE